MLLQSFYGNELNSILDYQPLVVYNGYLMVSERRGGGESGKLCPSDVECELGVENSYMFVLTVSSH